MPSTKDSILAQSGSSQQPDPSQPPKAPSSSTPPAAATAAASKSSQAPAVSQPRESEVPKRSLRGFDEAVAQSVTNLCEVRSGFVFTSSLSVQPLPPFRICLVHHCSLFNDHDLVQIRCRVSLCGGDAALRYMMCF